MVVSLIDKFLGRSLSIDKVTSSFTSKWSLENDWKIIPMNYEFSLFHFTSASDHDKVLNDGPLGQQENPYFIRMISQSFCGDHLEVSEDITLSIESDRPRNLPINENDHGWEPSSTRNAGTLT